jgi:hypothetical protein
LKRERGEREKCGEAGYERDETSTPLPQNYTATTPHADPSLSAPHHLGLKPGSIATYGFNWWSLCREEREREAVKEMRGERFLAQT